MDIENLTKDDWELLVNHRAIRMSFGLDNNATYKDLSKIAWGGKVMYSPSVISNKNEKDVETYILFGDGVPMMFTKEDLIK